MRARLAAIAESAWYPRTGPWRMAGALLAPVGAAVAAAAALKRRASLAGLLPRRAAGLPVVSVGALVAGGAGKTPFVLWLAARLVEEGLWPCLVTRGYGAPEPSDRPLVLGREAVMARGAGLVARAAGDEAVLLALRSGLPVAVARRRAEACAAALAPGAGLSRRPDLFLLDDGFQHLSLARDLDIVVTTGEEDALRVIPAGPLREGRSALAAADVVVAMGHGGPAQARAAVVAAGLVGDVAAAAVDGPASALAGRSVVAAVAIARPGRFVASLEAAGARVAAVVARPDHDPWEAADVAAIERAAAQADLVVTTEKDLVKLVGRVHARPLAALRIDVEVERGEVVLQRVLAAVRGGRRSV